MDKEGDCCYQRVQKGVREGNSPNTNLGFERVETIRKAVDEQCWVESIHQD